MIGPQRQLDRDTPGRRYGPRSRDEGDSREVAERERLMAQTDPTSSGGDQLFGHPKGLSFLFATEMWETLFLLRNEALLVCTWSTIC